MSWDDVELNGNGRRLMGNEQRSRLGFVKPLMVVTAAYPPRTSGTAVIMHNLLRGLKPEDVILVTRAGKTSVGCPDAGYFQGTSFVFPQLFFSHRLNQIWQRLLASIAPSLIARWARQSNCGAVLGVFPDLLTIEAARRGAQIAGLPFISYLHDTIFESFSDERKKGNALKVQERVFQDSSSILVVNEGMQRLYNQKYSFDTPVIPHILWNEDIQGLPAREPERSVFFGGGVYGINHISVGRVANAVSKIGNTRLVIGSKKTRESLEGYGIRGAHVEMDFYGERSQYIDALRRQGVLLVALNWPDEPSPVEPDELATIFSTKIVEYAMSGRPILAHCPEGYFVAKFIRKYRCGVVVSHRSCDALKQEITELLENRTKQRALEENCRETLKYFDGNRVTEIFKREIDAVMRGTDGPSLIHPRPGIELS